MLCSVRSIKRAAKENWEFSWQQTNWLSLWRQSEVKAKCLDYWNRYRHLGDIRARLDLTDQTTVLDVGCGFSSVLHYLPGRRFGLDPLGARYKSVYDYPFEVVEFPGEDIPFPNEFFDVVFCSNCIDHTSVPAKVMKEILRVLRASGHFIPTCEVFPSDRGIRNAGHPHSLTIESFLALPVGFKLLEQWVSPWYGLRGYALGENPTGRYEHILLLQRPPS
jgi:SAM-dependent methyltransferase